MSANICQMLVDEYINWLRQNISFVEINGICEITTPFLDRHNDQIQIYIKEEDGHYIISDDGYIITDLEMSGLEFNTEKRNKILNTILAGFGVSKVNYELQVKAQKHNFAQRKHNLIQAMLAINDMFMTTRSLVLSFFREDVEQYLRIHQVRFINMVSFTGRSGFIHNFDFAIPPSDIRPERLIRAINNPSRDNISSLIFAWGDTREVRSADAEAIAMLNDQEKTISSDAFNALEAYNIFPLLWSRRDQHIDMLAK